MSISDSIGSADNTDSQRKGDQIVNSFSVNRKKREELRKLVKQNAKCAHSSIYSQISFICRRLAILHEEGRISKELAMDMVLRAHDQLSHKSIPKQVVSNELHKELDKLVGQENTQFAMVMANTNSSVHVRKKPSDSIDEGAGNEDRYSENYWADVI